MKNKIELKKAIVLSIIVTFLFTILFLVILYKEYTVYTKNFNEKISGIFNEIIEKYPKIEKNELIAILNEASNRNYELFKEYGIDLQKASAVLINDTNFYKFAFLDVSLLLFFVISLYMIFLRYNYKKDKKIEEITKYIEEINQKNYKLDIEDNSEDELSILKNELYKTTVMLKEVAENSLKDKINIKNSMEDISHQLKTPITSIIIMLDNILENKNMDEAIRKDFIKDIKREINNIKFLVESILKLSKIDSNSVNFLKKEVKIEEILLESVKKVSLLSELKKVSIEISGNNTDKIFCDFKWQVEAITNILKNCIEHSLENGKIKVSYGQNKVYSKIIIRDFGKGIDCHDLPHIFERFYKGKFSSSDSIGIGLALSKSIIESNNGYISVESELGKGTVFTLKYLI